MDGQTLFGVLTLAGLVAFGASLTTYVLVMRRVRGVVADQTQAMLQQAKTHVEEAQVTLQALRTERMKAVATFKSAAGRSAAPADSGGQEIEIPDVVVEMARGAGIDIQRVLNGDVAEVEKAKKVASRLNGGGGGGGADVSWLD